jgi:uncharacterized NAD(P)/FAD-binding protein YdhS
MPRLLVQEGNIRRAGGRDVREPRASEWRGSAPLSAERTIAIVGTGFCGTVLARELLRRAQDRPLRVLLVGREEPGRGIAYARRRHPYLLNVPAGRMSASAADPEEFLRFARKVRPLATGDDYLPRALYGDYLGAALASAARRCTPQVRLEHIRADVIALEAMHRSAPVRLYLGAGSQVQADRVVLALGNPPPAPLPGTQHLDDTQRYIADPWAHEPTVRAGERVLLIGTGLTMADVVLAGSASTRRAPTFHALSRRGLLPAVQTRFPPCAADEHRAALLRAASVSVLQLWRTVRRLSQELDARDGDWREVVALARTLAPRLWQHLGAPERRRFLRHVRPYWDLHRHRLPESSAAALQELRRTGHLHLHAGRLLRLERAGRRIRALWQPRSCATPQRLLVDRVINCTGPDYDLRRTADRLLRSLIAQGVAVADPLGLGLATDAHGALRSASGGVADRIFYLGPLLRATHWEATAVAELREHAQELAAHLLPAQRPGRAPVAPARLRVERLRA